MGEYTIPGFLSGREYRFTIAGDQPSPAEMQRMQSILQRDEQAYGQAYTQATGEIIGPDSEEGTAISRGLERGIPQFQSALGSAVGAAGLEGVGEYLKSAARERQRETLARNPAIMESADFRDVRGLSSGLSYAGELLGEQLPLIAGTVGATGAGMFAGASAPVAAGLGTILVSYPQLFGSNIQRQEGEVAAGDLAGVDVPKAALTAIGQTALEAASNVLLVGQAGKGLGRALLTNIPAEAATEVGQQVLERKQAGLELDSEDAYREYLDAGVAGGTLGGIFGAAGSVGGRQRGEPTPPPAPDEDFGPSEFDDEADVSRRPEITRDEPVSPAGQAALDAIAPVEPTIDAAEPVTVSTLQALRIPSTAPIYNRVRSGALDQEATLRELETYGKNAAASDNPAIRRISPEILSYVADARAEISQPRLDFDQPDTGLQGVEAELPSAEPVAAPERADVVQPVETPVTTEPSPLESQVRAEETAAPPPIRKPRGRSPRRLKRPFTSTIAAAVGGIDPTGTVAAELKARGVTPKSAPGLFRKGGAKDLDNIVASEFGEYQDLMPDPTATYLDQGRIIDLLEQEAAGTPVQVGEQAAMQADRDTRAAAVADRELAAAVDSALADTFTEDGITTPPDDADRSAVYSLLRGNPRPDAEAVAEAAYDVASARLRGADPQTLVPEAPQAPLPEGIDVADPLAESMEAYQRPTPQTEMTVAGEQVLMPGVEPITDRQRAEARMAAPKRGAAAPVEEGSLFDPAARDQTGFDFSPVDPALEPLPEASLEALRQNDIVGALRSFAKTAKNATEKALAGKLADTLGGQDVQVMPDVEMLRIRDTISPEMRTYGEAAPAGLYMPMPTPAQLTKLRDEGRGDVADIYEAYGGQILLNESRGMGSTTLLHEAAHAATDSVLTNPSHPLTRQLDSLRTKLLTFMPESTYGLLNVRELLAEGMTNRTFRRDLSIVNPDGSKFSAWDMFKNSVMNFMRRLIGKPAKPLGSPADIVDQTLESILASSPSQRGAGDVLSASFRPSGAREVLGGFAKKVKVPTKGELSRMRAVFRNTRIPAHWKSGVIWASMPLDYIADAAVKYMPSARTMHDLIGMHKAAQEKIIKTVGNTAKAIEDHHTKNPDQVEAFESIRFTATTLEMDPRKNRAEYEGFSYRYDRLDSFGRPIDTVTSKRYKTAEDRAKAMRIHNASNIPNVGTAKTAFTQDADKLTAFDAMQVQYNGMNAEGKAALSRAFALPMNLWGELQKVLRYRLDTMFPGNRDLQERVYKTVYEKIFAENLIDPFQALSRAQGDFGLTYMGAHPETGKVVPFVHTFYTAAEQQDAVRRLDALGPEAQISGITPYMQEQGRRKKEAVPLDFITKILDVVEREGGLDTSVQETIAELVLDAAPETSFINAFRKRKGTEGYIGGLSPLETERLAAGDSVANIRSNAVRLAKNIVDIEYGARFAKSKKDLETEVRAYEARNNPDVVEKAKDQAEARVYYNALASYADSAFQRRGAAAQALTGGAYALTLGLNVSTALLTTMSVPMFLVPYLAGKHGMKYASQAVGVAGRVLAGTGRTRTEYRVAPDGTLESFKSDVGRFDYSLDNEDLTDPASPRAYLAALQDAGRVNGVFGRSLVQDITDGQGAAARSDVGRIAQKLVAKSGILQHYAERYSRETALISSYLLSLRKAAKDANMGDFSVKQLAKKLEAGELRFTQTQMDAAALDAVNTSEKTNGSMYAAAGPQASQSDLGSILYLFKRHPLSMYNLMFQTMMRSVRSKAEIAQLPLEQQAEALEDRRIAAFQIGGMMGAMGLTAGALGLPLVQQIGWMYDLFAEDDEEDFETVARIALGEFGAFGMVDYLTGLKVSERVGMSGAFYRAGFASEDLPTIFQIIEGLGGPVVGLAIKQDRTAKLFAEGDIWRGTESLLPSSVANMLRGIRYADEGIRTRRHDPVIDDISAFGATAQFFGFMPAEYARQLDVNAAGLRIDNAINKKRTALLSKLNRAETIGDWVTARDARREMAEFNRRNPQNPITDETIDNSRRAFQRRTDLTQHGVAYTERNLARIMDTVNAIGPATPYD